jgi:hypothetical protein
VRKATEDYTQRYTIKSNQAQIRLHIHQRTAKSVVGKGLAMKDFPAKRVVKLTVVLVATGAFLFVFNSSIYAQRNPIDIFNAERARQRAEAEQRRALEHIRDEGGMRPAVVDERYKRALMAQIREDFHRIQVINNEMLRTAFAERAPDYDSLSEKASDIKKRASRIKSMIRLPPPREERKQVKLVDAANHDELKESLVMLRNLIASFVNNPYFHKKPGVIDVQGSDKASSDLRDIIDLSELIRKNARRLDKGSR